MEQLAERTHATTRNRPRTAAAVGLGLLLGVLVRDLAFVVASWIVPGSGPRECGDQSIAECAIDAVPGVLGKIVVFGFAASCVALLSLALGVVSLVVGWRFDRPAVGLGLVTLGTGLVVPAIWFAAFLVGIGIG